MRRYSPAFEKSLKRQIAAAIAQSPALQRQAKRVNKSRFSFLSSPAADGLFYSFLYAVVILLFALHSGSIALGLSGIAVCFALLVPSQALRLISTITEHSNLAPLRLLPVSDNSIFQGQLRLFFIESIWLLVSICVCYGAALFIANVAVAPLVWWVALPIVSLCSWAAVMGRTGLCVLLLPLRVLALCSGLVFIVPFGFFIGRDHVLNWFKSFITQFNGLIDLVLPTAWPNALLQLLLGTPRANQVVVLILLLMFFLVVSRLRVPLQRALSPVGYGLLETSPHSRLDDNVLPNETGHDSPDISVPPAPVQHDSHIRLYMRTRWLEFYASAQHDSHVELYQLTRSWDFSTQHHLATLKGRQLAFWHKLSPREKVLYDFSFPDGYYFWPQWKRLAIGLCCVCALALLAGLINPVWRSWLLGFGVVASVFFAVAIVHSRGQGFDPMHLGTGRTLLFCLFPIGYRELSRMLLKLAIAQTPFVGAYVLFCVAIFGVHTGASAWAVVETSLKITMMFLSLHYISVITALNNASEGQSTAGVRVSSIRVVVGLFTIVSLLILYVIALVFTWNGEATLPTHVIAWAACLLACAEGALLHRLFAWWHNRLTFDTVATA